MQVKLSVVVPAFNEERLLGSTIQSIRGSGAAFTSAGWEWEIVVCDNNSTDRTAEIARAAGARVVHEPVNQIGRARNTGAAAARGEWILFVDADSQPSQELLQDVVNAIRSGEVLAGGSTLRLDSDHRFALAVTRFWNRVSRFRRLVAGSFIFVNAAAFHEIGGFSNEFFASEEIDLSKKLKRLAKERGLEIRILHQHPLLTSARKMHLYTPGEHLRFLLRTALARGKNLKDRDGCPTWYDGRR